MIEVDDIVQVNMEAAGMSFIPRARVLGMPIATGDCWKFLDLDRDYIVYTSEPITIYKRPAP